MRAYLQAHRWITAATLVRSTLNPEDYGYYLDDEKGLFPIILSSGRQLFPEDFPGPCSCLKCARKNICPCRVADISCCEFCNCRGVCKYNEPS